MVQSPSSRIPCLLLKVRLVLTNQSFQLTEPNYLYTFLQHESDELISKQSTVYLDTNFDAQTRPGISVNP